MPAVALKYQYVLGTFGYLKMKVAPETEEEKEEEEKEELGDNCARDEEYDSNEESNSSIPKDANGKVKSQLVVDNNHDRSFKPCALLFDKSAQYPIRKHQCVGTGQEGKANDVAPLHGSARRCRLGRK
jgi:hypothetical protein